MSFIFGGDTGLSYAELQQRRRQLEANRGRYSTPRNAGEGLTALGIALSHRLEQGRLNKAAAAGQEQAGNAFNAFQRILSGGGAPNAGAPASPSISYSGDISGLSENEIYSGFMDTVKAGGVQNPFALAAIASTGKAESGFSPGNVNRTWSDPSESGAPGTAGGIMSWRGPRLSSMHAFAKAKGENPGSISPQTQAEFFLQEDPQLIAALNGAQSIEEAQSLVNNAWKFAGYNRAGGEAGRRLQLAQQFLPSFQGSGQPVQVASADPQQAFQAAAQPQSSPVPQPQSQPRPQQQAQATPVQVAQARPQQTPQLDPRVFELMADPNLSPGQQAVMRLMYQDYMQRNAPVDPLKQLQIQKMQRDLSAPPERKVIEGVDGFKYYQDTGERVLPGVEKPVDELKQLQIRKAEAEVGKIENPDRQVIEGADGFKYYQDTGERVLPNVQTPNEQYRQISGDEAAAMGLDPTKGYNIAPDGKISQIGGNGTNVTVNTESDFKVPNGYMRDPNNPNQVVAIPGGPAQKLGSETAGRIGLAEDALGQLDEVKQFAEQGDMTGLGNYIMGSVLGRGEQGQKVRELKAASEAITRMLTGAGMNEAEAMREVDLYLPKVTDDALTVVDKVNQLKRRLQSIIDVTDRGRAGPPQANEELSVDDLLKKYGD